ncbi:MAG: hypothetical protein DLM54_06790 [Acidimicrobiales bacterium]|nr:MAG: hypothetical protein DLM54_06790 [Acidimicrobiales bacterium]
MTFSITPAVAATLALSATLVGVAIALAVLAVVGAWISGRHLARAGLAKRLAVLADRMSDSSEIGRRMRLEPTLSLLDRAAERAAETRSNVRAEATRLAQALDAMPQGVVICDDSGRVTFRNARAAALMGGRHTDVIAAQAVEELLAASAAGTPAERTLDLYGPPRQTLTVRTHAIGDEYRPLGVVAVLDDVSERRRLDAVRRDFVANVSHELKTPVGALGLLAETILAEGEPMVIRRLARRIEDEAFRVSRIIDDLLDLSRIEAEESPPREPVPVALVMADAVERARAGAEAAGVSLALAEPPEGLYVVGDRRQLVSALYNLVENAIKYSPRHSSVEISARVVPCSPEDRSAAAGDMVELVVADHGVGIPARDLERIFERFYRVDQGRSRYTGGTGLGLAIVRHVASNHQGRVTVESREGEGSTFRLQIPGRSGRTG